MTGYGKAAYEDEEQRISVEVKSLNTKYADVIMHLPKGLLAYEIAWRNRVIEYLQRGKIILSMNHEHKENALIQTRINQAHFKYHYHILQSLAQEVNASSQALFQLALQFPEVVTKVAPEFDYPKNLQRFERVIQTALQECDQSRQKEGLTLANALLNYLKDLKRGLERIEKLGPLRSKAIRIKLQDGIKRWMASHTLDENRLEQEMIYYIERLDITEEQVRLGQHLAYFEEVMQNSQVTGKKLGFIAQEIGREINTIGSKANDAAIQKEVIHMKDTLEKIKEQLQNIL
eukprot:CAMPEP_0116867696 /NCGR_PEP_ID=MMETSP0418-20121206/26767_1 /TAXON_ID=1158023 /ORGANISM="Astrosyne radiata, Strain 13vi08-1A" /LENGTH=288 /DNA_ID=CAMNT_0004503549 /DNA_START=201 /DNA_END=1067 /DNA_ORIENTATION=-